MRSSQSRFLVGSGGGLPGLARLVVFAAVVLILMPMEDCWGGQLKGIVRHGTTGDPLSEVRITVLSPGGMGAKTLLTGGDGRFGFVDLTAGSYEVVVSAVGFGLVRKAVAMPDSEELELEVFLAPGTLITEELTVEARMDKGTSSLSAAEIHQLKSVLMDDPLRALKQLPSLASGDDFNSGFAVQGSGFDRVAVLLDGIPVYSFLHTAEGLEDTGSTTLLSADLLENTTLQLPGTSGLWSGTSGGHLSLQTRTGNGDRFRGLTSVSGSAFLAVAEGPAGEGSWIASARKSYIDWIVRKVDPESTLNFGFYDLFAKVVQPIGSSHQLSISGFHGNTGIHDVVEGSAINSVENGRFVSDVFHLEWSGTYTSRLTSSTHFYVQQSDSTNRNTDKLVLWENDESIFGLRSLWDYRVSDALTFTLGAAAERWDVANSRYYYVESASAAQRPASFGSGLFLGTGSPRLSLGAPAFRTTSPGEAGTLERYPWSSYKAEKGRGTVFSEARARIASAVELRGGWAYDDQAGLSRGFHSPTLGVTVTPAANQLISASWGQSGQIPFFNQLFDAFGNSRLAPERARSLNLQWDWGARQGLGVSVSGYLRRRTGVPWRKDGLWRLVDGLITPPNLDPYENRLEDRSHGAEVRLRRTATNGLSGWIGYAWGGSRWNEEPGEWFPGNYDQRHGIGVYGHYRWSSAFEVSLKWRWAQGLPLPAYAQLVEGRYFLAETRNQERLPDYSRFDFRFGKGFDRDRFRLTLFVEVLNLLNRENLRFSGHDIDSVNPATGRIHGLVQEQIPILPTAGLTIEF